MSAIWYDCTDFDAISKKENMSLWNDTTYEVKKIDIVPHAGTVYCLGGCPHGVLRPDMLLG